MPLLRVAGERRSAPPAAYRALKPGDIAESIENCASSARFVLIPDAGRQRWPAELAATARQRPQPGGISLKTLAIEMA